MSEDPDAGPFLPEGTLYTRDMVLYVVRTGEKIKLETVGMILPRVSPVEPEAQRLRNALEAAEGGLAGLLRELRNMDGFHEMQRAIDALAKVRAALREGS